MAGLSARIASYVAGAQTRPLPAKALARARLHVLDSLAAMISGSAMEPGQRGIAYVRGVGGKTEASVAGARFRTSAVNAALAGGMCAHADETDDSHPFSLTHPGSAVVPAALAMAERERASGLAFLKAVAVGYDICARTGMALGASDLRASGKDCHAFGGTMGATAAAAALAGLDTGQCATALSYGAQQASGMATLFRETGHVEKAFVFAGMPARDGVAAATMVQSGMTGVPDPFDGEPNFLSVHSVAEDPAAAFSHLGRPLEITRTNIKRWSAGSPAQAILDSVETLMAKHGFGAGDVERLDAHLHPRAALVVDRQRMSDINAQFLVAVMLLDGTLTFESSHDAARAADPAVKALAERIRVVPDKAMPADQSRREALVKLTLTSGKRLSHRTRAVRGTFANPMSAAEVEAKALDLMAPVLGKSGANALIRAVRALDKARRVDRLGGLLQKP